MGHYARILKTFDKWKGCLKWNSNPEVFLFLKVWIKLLFNFNVLGLQKKETIPSNHKSSLNKSLYTIRNKVRYQKSLSSSSLMKSWLIFVCELCWWLFVYFCGLVWIFNSNLLTSIAKPFVLCNPPPPPIFLCVCPWLE